MYLMTIKDHLGRGEDFATTILEVCKQFQTIIKNRYSSWHSEFYVEAVLHGF